jgi:glutamine synthetase
MICALTMAIDKHAGLLRATVASAGNDHRLGANEAPPAIISIFLGEQLYDVIEQLEKGKATSSKKGGVIKIGVTSLPQLPRDATDRNRTSPFAFTGNKFEFRALGSSQNCSPSDTVLNTIVADAIDEICTKLEKGLKDGKNFNKALQLILKAIVKKHKRVLFNGDNYTEAWKKEAKKRGLPNLVKTPEALKEYIKKESILVFEKYGILTKRELESRYTTYLEIYEAETLIEAGCANTIAKTMIVPAAIRYQTELAESINAAKAVLGKISQTESKKLLAEITKEIESVLKDTTALEAAINSGKSTKIISIQNKLRTAVDNLEGLLAKDEWPLPSYTEMMFVM